MAETHDDLPLIPPLALRETFPPVPTAAWDDLARADLDGEDVGRRLFWQTDEGLVVRAFYRREDAAGLEPPTDAVPGTSPFTRGSGAPAQPADSAVWPADAVRADRFHEAGATAVQELAYAIAEGADRLAASVPGGVSVPAAAARLEFVFAVGSTYFVEIAKLRAARLLWASVLSAFEVPAVAMRLHARTARANTSVLDPYVNLLRATTEAMSAVIGGADTVWAEACGYEPHLAANVPRLLAEEAHLDAVADPGAGSYYLEALTDALAREAWTLFQRVEAAGGYAAFVRSGARDIEVAASADARARAVACRRRTLVGVNNYPDPDDRSSLPEPACDDSEGGSPPPQRLAAPFEALRGRTARHAAATGRVPVAHLLTRGHVGMRTARANFCLNLFGCAGFAVTQGDALPNDADLVVLCSADHEYPALAREAVAQVSCPVAAAGHPSALAETLTPIGVQGFVHARSDVLQTLSFWQDRLGMAR